MSAVTKEWVEHVNKHMIYSAQIMQNLLDYERVLIATVDKIDHRVTTLEHANLPWIHVPNLISAATTNYGHAPLASW
jgi:hypothetical protein